MKKTIMLVLGGGGHTKQLLILADKLKEKYRIEYVIKKEGKKGKKRLDGKIFRILNPRPMDDANIFKTILRLFPYTFQAIKILAKSQAKAIIICGPAISTPIAFLGKMIFNNKS